MVLANPKYVVRTWFWPTMSMRNPRARAAYVRCSLVILSTELMHTQSRMVRGSGTLSHVCIKEDAMHRHVQRC